MKTSIINPEVHLTPTKEKKNTIEINQPGAVVNKTPSGEGIKNFISLMESNFKYPVKNQLVNENINVLDGFPFKILPNQHMNRPNIKAFFVNYFNEKLLSDSFKVKNLLMYASFSMILDNEDI